MNNKEKLLLALGEVDEKYVAESGSKLKKSVIIKAAAVLTIVISLSLYLFIPFAPLTVDLSDYEGSSYYPLIEKISDYQISFVSYKYKNYFQLYMSRINNAFAPKGDASINDNAAPPPKENVGNGSYIESTDNQVEGVIESDLMKMTDKYIFRLGYQYEMESNDKETRLLSFINVYSIAGENSALVARYDIQGFANETYSGYESEMYLSEDGNTITLISPYRIENNSRTGIVSIDVSDINNIKEKSRASVDGSLNTTRMSGDKLIVISDYSFNRGATDFAKPETFVPTIDTGSGAKCIELDDIIYPDKLTSTNYRVVTLLDSENLRLLGSKALLNFTSDVYVSENNIYITREYVNKIVNEEDQNEYENINTSDIVVLGYEDDSLDEKHIITVLGYAKDQYSFDEYNGYLRVVTSTLDSKSIKSEDNDFQYLVTVNRSASLYVLDLQTGAIRASVENFAPEKEQATAVRFDKDKCYVCTAEVVSFTDPVFFFDLSDYDNITYTDTGIIEGYSDSLINYGDGKLLGIGREDWQSGKIEIYEDIGGEVVGTYRFAFYGDYSTDYKSYLVNREDGLFGFGVNYFYEYDEQTQYGESYNCYILISLAEDEIKIQKYKIKELQAEYVRAVYLDGYLYITLPNSLVVEKIK